MQNWAETVKHYQKKSGLGYVAFASAVGVSHVTIWRWTNGFAKPRPEAISHWVSKMKGIKNV